MPFDNKQSLKNAVRSFMVQDSNGRFDLKASELKFHQAAIQHITNQEADQNLIAAAMTVLFNQRTPANLNQDFIVSEVNKLMVQQVPELGDPSAFSNTKARILDFLKENTGEGKTYDRKVGHGGGYFRVADRKPVESK